MSAMFIANFVTILLLMGFGMLLITGNVFEKRIEKLLTLSATLIAFLIIIDVANEYLASQDTLNTVRYFTTAIGYNTRIAVLNIFVIILIGKDTNRLRQWAPVLIISVLTLTNYWTHLIFEFTEDNLFIRGVLSLVPHLAALAYMELLCYHAIVRTRVTDMGEALSIFYMVASCSAAVVIETVTDNRFLLTGSMTSSAVIYYTYLYVQVYKTDPLTRVYNRTSFNKDVESRLNRTMGIINVDIDNLKQINDIGGHSIGDKAICEVAKILKNRANNEYRVYRVGGDEFYVLGVGKELSNVQAYVRDVKELLADSGLSASFGTAIYKAGDDFHACCIQADQKMYLNKKRKPENTDFLDAQVQEEIKKRSV